MWVQPNIMIPRECTTTVLLLVLTLGNVHSEDSRVYDTNEWIPIDKNCPTCYEPEQQYVAEEPTSIERLLLVDSPYSAEPHTLNKKPDKSNEQKDIVPRRLPKRQQSSTTAQTFPQASLRLNEGEVEIQQYFNQQPYQNSPVPQFVQTSNRPPAQLRPQLMLVSPGQQYFLQNQQFGPPPPLFHPQTVQGGENLNYYPQNYNLPPAIYQPQTIPSTNASFKLPNSGIGVTSSGLSQSTLRNNNNFIFTNPAVLNNPQNEKESVQLLYVPIESLNQRQPPTYQSPYNLQKDLTNKKPIFQQTQKKVNLQNLGLLPDQTQILKQQDYLQPTQQPEQDFLQNNQKRKVPLRPEVKSYQNYVPAVQVESTEQRKQHQLENIQNDFARQALEALKLQLQLDQNEARPQQQLYYTTPSVAYETTTKKRKSHQPPLAVYMGGEGDVTVSDVLSLLKNAKSITVQDEIKSNSPQVFVGPNDLKAPDGYVKFELPYLNALESNRIERKVDQLPFFVAPLSYKAPDGYSKIPLPPPHVGSVVISTKDKQREKAPTRPPQQLRFENFYSEDHYQIPNLQSYQTQPQKPVQLQNIINEAPLRTYDNRPVYSNLPHSLPNPPAIKYPVTPRPDPLRQTINQYELEQINSHFVPNYFEQFEDDGTKIVQDDRIPEIYNYDSRTNRTSSPANIQYVTEKLQTTTDHSNSNYRIAFKNNQQSPPSTQSSPNKDKYTVLEEFSINRNPTTIQPNYDARNTLPPQKSRTETVFRPSSKFEYQQIQNQPQYQYVSEPIQQQQQQQQKEISQQPTAQTYPQTTYSFFDLNNSEYIPTQNANVYKLVPQQNSQKKTQNFKEIRPILTTTPRFVQTTQPTVVTEQSYESSDYKLRGNHQAQVYQESPDPSYNNQNYNLPEELPQVNPNLHNLINNLQDQSLRPLLIPASIAPTVEQQSYNSQIQDQKLQYRPSYTSTPYHLESTSSPSTARLSTTTSAPTVETTTPFKRQRGRQRARVTTTTYAPTRASPRTRKPTTRTRLNRYRPEQDESSKPVYNPTRERVASSNEEEEEVKSSRKPAVQQRFRSRTRPPPRTDVTQRTSTTNFEIEHDTRPSFESKVQDSSASFHQPQSYMQFEHSVDEVKNAPHTLTSTHKSFNSPEYSRSTPPATKEQPQLSVDVLINHPISESNGQEPRTDRNYVRLNENYETNLDANDDVTSTTTRLSHFRGRVRTRPTLRTTTPIAIESTSRASPVEKTEDDEFYGFIRTPSFARPSKIHIQNKKFTEEPKLYSSTYVSTTQEPQYSVQTEDSAQYEHLTENEIQILPNSIASSTPKVEYRSRPKFSLSTAGLSNNNNNFDTSTTEVVPAKRYTIVQSTTPSTLTPKLRIQGRMRVPNKKYSSRGTSHFKVPDNLKHTVDEDALEGGNYPVQFLRAQGITEKPGFQITVDPDAPTQEPSDQIPYSSINRPRIVPHENKNSEFTKSNGGPVLNYVNVDRKIIESQEQTRDVANSNVEEEKTTEAEVGNAETTEHSLLKSSVLALLDEDYATTLTTTTRKPRRRGNWKVIKRPVDPFETAESQNIGNVFANSFTHEVKPEKKVFANEEGTKENNLVNHVVVNENITSPIANISNSNTTVEVGEVSQPKKENFLDSLFNMFGMNHENQELVNDGEITDDAGVTATTLEETTLPANVDIVTVTENLITTTSAAVVEEDPKITTTSTENSINLNTSSSNKEDETLKIDLLNSNTLPPPTTQQPSIESQTFNFESIKTSISTEISHETEICYRGKCVKTNGIKSTPMV